jgi:hypothetical protein
MATRRRKATPAKRRRKSTVGSVRHRMSPRRRSPRKMGALPVSVELIGGSIAGAYASRVISANMRPPMNPADTDVRPLVTSAIGVAVMYLGKGNKVMEGAGLGMIAESITTLISSRFIPRFGGPNPGMGNVGYRNGVVGNVGYRYGTVGAHQRRLPYYNRGRMLNGTAKVNSGGGGLTRAGYDGC